MVSVITAANRQSFEPLLDSMHRDRKRVFLDWLKWDLAAVDGLHERDQFDTPSAVYLIDSDGTGCEHLGSVRLLSTDRPHLLSDIFPNLCATSYPRSSSAWEITRFCTAPSIKDRAAAGQVRRRLCVAMIEFALLYGIHHFVFVTHAGWAPEILAIGWDVEPLGLPQIDGQQTIAAFIVHVDTATLARLRDKWAFGQPLLRHDLGFAAAAVAAA